jgi:hypothetical protein
MFVTMSSQFLLSLANLLKVGLCDPHPDGVSMNFRMPEADIMKLGMHFIAHESISKAYFVNPSH